MKGKVTTATTRALPVEKMLGHKEKLQLHSTGLAAGPAADQEHPTTLPDTADPDASDPALS